MHAGVQQPHGLVALARRVDAEGVWKLRAGSAGARIRHTTSRTRQVREIPRLAVGTGRHGTIAEQENRPSLSALADSETRRSYDSKTLQVLARIREVKIRLILAIPRTGTLLLRLDVAIFAFESFAAVVHPLLNRSVGIGLRLDLEAWLYTVTIVDRNVRVEFSPLPSAVALLLLREWSGEAVGDHEEAQSQRAYLDDISGDFHFCRNNLFADVPICFGDGL